MKFIYNYEMGLLDLLEKVEFNKVVVIEGLYFFYDEWVWELVDFGVYLDISEEVKINWKI